MSVATQKNIKKWLFEYFSDFCSFKNKIHIFSINALKKLFLWLFMFHQKFFVLVSGLPAWP
jgi:hypothetical protein